MGDDAAHSVRRFDAVFGGEVTPDNAWAALRDEPGAVLVDVRSEAEWSFVGAPDLTSIDKSVWLLSWRTYPGMRPNVGFIPAFRAMLEQQAAKNAAVEKVFMLCRSGVRSLEAAQVCAAELSSEAIHSGASEQEDGDRVVFLNVKEGFEGDLDENGCRGRKNGWKQRGLAWRQS